MKMQDVTGGQMKIGSTTYNMVEAKINGTVVWPINTAITYEILSYTVYYYSYGQWISGATQIPAAGGYARVFGNVKKTEGGTSTTLTDVELTFSRIQASGAMYLSDNKVYGPDRGTTVSNQDSAVAWVVYMTSAEQGIGTIYQQANVKTPYGSPSDNTIVDYDHPGTPSITYSVSLSADRYRKATSSDVCPASGTASGDYVQLYCTAEHTTTTPYPYTIYRTQNYKYTATGDTLYPETTVYDSGTTNVTSTTTDDVSGNITGSATGFTRSGLQVTIANRLKTIGAERSVTYSVSNGDASSSVTLYQQANAYIRTTSTPSISCSFHDYSQGDLLPANGGSIRVDYVSQITETETYTSGSYDTTSPLTSSVQDLLNCSTLTSSVSGSGYFNITVGRNSGGSRYVSLTIWYSTDYYKPLGLWQDGNAEPVAATLNPYIFPSGTNKGHIALRLTVASADLSKVTWPITVNDIVLNITPTGGSVQPHNFSEVEFPTPATGLAYSQYISRLALVDGSQGVAQVVKDSTKPTSDQVTDFTCEAVNYSIMT